MAKAKRKLSAYNRFIAKELRGKKGGTKAQRAARFKAAVSKWKRTRGSRSKPRKRSTKSSSKAKPRARVRPKSTGGRSRMGFNSQKIMKYVRLAALVAPAAAVAMQAGSPSGKVSEGLRKYTGYNMATGQFNFAHIAEGWGPYLASVVATYGIPKLAGIIRGL